MLVLVSSNCETDDTEAQQTADRTCCWSFKEEISGSQSGVSDDFLKIIHLSRMHVGYIVKCISVY